MITFNYKCFEAIVSTDERSSKHFGYFINKTDAKEACKGKGWYGGDGWVNSCEIDIKIYETREEFDGVTKDNEKQIALSKLSKREKEILGLI